MLKKIISVFLSLSLVIGVFTAVPCVASAEDTTELPFLSAGNYAADCIIYGVADPFTGESSGNPIFSIATSRSYMYKILAETVIEDEALVFNSVFWQNLKNALGGEFLEIANWQEALYSLLIMDYLTYFSESEEYQSNLTKTTLNFSYSIYKDILDNAADTYNNEVDEIIKNTSLTDAVEFSDKYGYTVKLKEFNTLVEDIGKVAESAKDYYSNLTKALAVQQASATTVDFLLAMKAQADDNEYFISAVDKIVEWYTASFAELAFDGSVFTMVNYSFKATFDCIVEAFPALKEIVGGLKTYTAGLNWLFNSDDISENNLKLITLYIIDSYSLAALREAKNSYISNPTEENANIFVNNYLCYLNYQKYASNHADGFLTSILFDGLYNKIKNLFSDTNEMTYEELKENLESDINACKTMGDLTNRFYDVYCGALNYEGNTVLGENTDETETEPEEVSDIQFVTNSFSMFMNYTLNNPAIAYPVDAVNSDIAFSSGNTAVATVDQNGKITPVAPGTVKIYASSANGTTSSCNITVLPFEATEQEHGYEITAYTGSGGSVVIPKFAQNKPIISIGASAFEKNSITGVTIPSSVTSIGEKAFYSCKSMTSVTVPAGVTAIGRNAFRLCSKLQSASILGNVTQIEYGTFFNCSKLTSISLPAGVTGIGERAFGGCSALTRITLPSTVRNIDTDAFYNCTKLTRVNIPYGVKSISPSVFSGCESLTSISIPSSVVYIKNHAFSRCYSLKTITIPDSVKIINYGAFAYCKKLTSIKLPSSLEVISNTMFKDCVALKSITIPYGVTSIGESSFSGCTALESITIPSSVVSIGKSAFNGCTALSSATIPESVTSINSTAFSGCTALTVTCPYLSASDTFAQQQNISRKLYGDVNSDYIIDVNDIVGMKKQLLMNAYDIDTAVFDCNKDTRVDILDFIRLKKYLAGENVLLGE